MNPPVKVAYRILKRYRFRGHHYPCHWPRTADPRHAHTHFRLAGDPGRLDTAV